MGKWDDPTEFSIGVLINAKYQLTQKADVGLVEVNQTILVAMDKVLAELKSRPRPPPINGYPKLEAEELAAYKESLLNQAPFSNFLRMIIDEVSKDINRETDKDYD